MKYSSAVEGPARVPAKPYFCFWFVCLCNLRVEPLRGDAVNISILSPLDLEILKDFYTLGYTFPQNKTKT